jgi:uncharacterized protein YfdQ (DUF2303 family)
MDEDNHTSAAIVADLARKGTAPHVLTLSDGRQFIASPNDVRLQEVSDPHGMIVAPPVRTVQALTVQTKDSLSEYVNRFKTADTVLLADIDTSRIVAVIDYHSADRAAFAAHKATLTLQHSVEWKAWAAIDGKMFDQQTFARFLEENAPDIAVPTGAELLEVARDMRAAKGADFRKKVRTAGDIEEFEYVETTNATTRNGTVEVPSKFLLRIPVYFGEREVELYAFLRWKLEGGELTLGVALHRPEHVRQAVFQQIVLDIADRVERLAIFGKVGG